MANLQKCLTIVLEAEGGYKLHIVSGDRGGVTFAGISRNTWPDWIGWKVLDRGYTEKLDSLVYHFYFTNFWQKIWGNEIIDQEVAYLLFDFAVNAGVSKAIKLCQAIVHSHPDGVMGPLTIKALNEYTNDPKEREIFMLRYSLGRIYFYKNIARKDKRRKRDVIKSNMKFLPGWIHRVQDSLENTKKFGGVTSCFSK